MIHEIKKTLISADSRLLEIENSMLSIAVGFWFFIYSDVYNLPVETLRYMKFLPAWIWGIVFSAFGIVHLLALFTGFRKIRKEVLLIKACLWFWTAINVLSGNAFSILGLFALVIMTMNIIAFLQIQIFKRDGNFNVD